MNQIGLNVQLSKDLAARLNYLLANYHIFYINVRGYHWNIRGMDFFELHQKFEDLYTDVALKIDETAERIKTLGETPLHTYSDYLQLSSIAETKNVSEGPQAVKHVLGGLRQLLILEREILQLAGDAEDEGTNALMSDYIREQEKMIWMYHAYLS